jgi:hypothetical protein
MWDSKFDSLNMDDDPEKALSSYILQKSNELF